ncbi:MAG: lamin tail domain-containing protein [Spirochaetes bacterium]|nr:lamin tail domain-containing protein [Spirochaetota bacterium]
MKGIKNKLLFFLFFFLPVLLHAATKLKIILNTNTLVPCQRGYLVVQALNADDSLDTSYNGQVEVKSSYALTEFRSELEERDYNEKIIFFLTNGQIQMGTDSGTRGIGFWSKEIRTMTLTARDTPGFSLSSFSTDVSVIDFNSSYKIIINEIMCRTSDSSKYQWVEIYNNSLQSVSLINFKLRRLSYNTGSVNDYTIGVSKIIQPGNFAIICDSSYYLRTFFPDVIGTSPSFTNIPIIENSLSLSSSDDQPVFLIDPSGKYCDGLIYTSSWGNEDLYNISIERRDKSRPAFLKDNWGECASSKYWNYGARGTPGQENSLVSQSGSTELKITVNMDKKVFSPKAGESLQIDFSLTENARVTVRLFDSQGYHIMDLLHHEDVGTLENRTIHFYGDCGNKVLPPGIYLLHFEALNAQTGKTAQAVKSFAIGNKL